ncbi:MAG TPA: hypothetical protein VLI04_02025 [Nocardioidaceae bacterium]|nr:hypothetical protein [Nocardioidaceae bacterium]
MSDPVISTCIQNTRAVAFVLDQAEKVGLPDPMSVAIGRGYDNEISRNAPRIRLQFKTAEDLQAWADHLEVEVFSMSTVASSFGRIASVWHHDTVAEWLDVPVALTAVTEHPVRALAVVP